MLGKVCCIILFIKVNKNKLIGPSETYCFNEFPIFQGEKKISCKTVYPSTLSEMKMIQVSHTLESYEKSSLTQCPSKEIRTCQSKYFQFGINHIQSVLIQTDATIHQSQYFLRYAIFKYSNISLYIIYTQVLACWETCNFSDTTTWSHGIGKKNVHEYGQINRNG